MESNAKASYPWRENVLYDAKSWYPTRKHVNQRYLKPVIPVDKNSYPMHQCSRALDIRLIGPLSSILLLTGCPREWTGLVPICWTFPSIPIEKKKNAKTCCPIQKHVIQSKHVLSNAKTCDPTRKRVIKREITCNPTQRRFIQPENVQSYTKTW